MSSDTSGDHSWTLGTLPDDSDMEVREIGRPEQTVLLENAAPPLTTVSKPEKPALSPSKPPLTPALRKSSTEAPEPVKPVLTPTKPPLEPTVPKLKKTVPDVPPPEPEEPEIPKLTKIEPAVEIPKLTKIEVVRPPPIKLYNNLENMYMLVMYIEDEQEFFIAKTYSETWVRHKGEDLRNYLREDMMDLINNLVINEYSDFRLRTSFRTLREDIPVNIEIESGLAYKQTYYDMGEYDRATRNALLDEAEQRGEYNYVLPDPVIRDVAMVGILKLRMDSAFGKNGVQHKSLKDLLIGG